MAEAARHLEYTPSEVNFPPRLAAVPDNPAESEADAQAHELERLQAGVEARQFAAVYARNVLINWRQRSEPEGSAWRHPLRRAVYNLEIKRLIENKHAADAALQAAETAVLAAMYGTGEGEWEPHYTHYPALPSRHRRKLKLT